MTARTRHPIAAGRALALSGLGTLALAACATPAPPPPSPAPRIVVNPPAPAPAPPPAPALDWRDEPQTPGTWRWELVNGQSTAQFVGADGKPLALLRCDPAQGTVLLARRSALAPPVALLVRTTLAAPRMLSAQESPAAMWVGVPLPARDPLLDALAFSRGRFALELLGQEALYLPSWPELSRVIEDCR